METPQGGVHGEAAGAGSPSDARVSPPLSPASAALLNARWNPTKEQVAVLEGLYENGVRTPSAEQIQHIAARLRDHGPIEAKNVFYWFQNHKARDRQKQKQESFAYFTRLLHRTPPLPVIIRPPGPPYPHLGRVPASPPVLTMAPPAAAACNNGGDGGGNHVMYRAPYYMPPPPPPPPPPPEASAANAGYYNLQQAHHRAVMYPRMDITQDKQMHQAGMYHATPYGPSHVAPAKRGGADGGASADQHAGRSRETLELFPLRPTFVPPDNKARGAASLTSPAQLTASASFSGGESESLVDSPKSDAVAPLPFYDFFGLQSAGR